MKTMWIYLISGIFFLFSMVNKMIAQDFDKVNPAMNKLLLDTTLVHVIEVTMQPGEKSDIHSHAAHFYYALTDGRLIVHYLDGETDEYEMKAGECGYSDAERPHMAENVGDKVYKFLIVELKEHPYKAGKMKADIKNK